GGRDRNELVSVCPHPNLRPGILLAKRNQLWTPGTRSGATKPKEDTLRRCYHYNNITRHNISDCCSGWTHTSVVVTAAVMAESAPSKRGPRREQMETEEIVAVVVAVSVAVFVAVFVALFVVLLVVLLVMQLLAGIAALLAMPLAVRPS
ncbi:hypothetical protein Vretimale_4338, partial [Volvox reticuliferus]